MRESTWISGWLAKLTQAKSWVGTTPSGYGTSTYSYRVEIGRYFRVTVLRYQPKNWRNRLEDISEQTGARMDARV